MAQTFKNARLAPLPTISVDGFTAAYTVPAGTTAVIFLAQVTNVESAQVGVSVRWKDASAADAITYLVDEVQVPSAAALNVLAGKLVLEAGDSIEAGQEGTPTSALELTLSILELTNE